MNCFGEPQQTVNPILANRCRRRASIEFASRVCRVTKILADQGDINESI